MSEMTPEKLRALRRGHYYCEDSWYSCPLAEDGCADESQGDKCNCGAEEHNAHLDAAASAWEADLKAAGEMAVERQDLLAHIKGVEKALYDAIEEGGCPQYEIAMDDETGRARPAALAAKEKKP